MFTLIKSLILVFVIDETLASFSFFFLLQLMQIPTLMYADEIRHFCF